MLSLISSKHVTSYYVVRKQSHKIVIQSITIEGYLMDIIIIRSSFDIICGKLKWRSLKYYTLTIGINVDTIIIWLM